MAVAPAPYTPTASPMRSPGNCHCTSEHEAFNSEASTKSLDLAKVVEYYAGSDRSDESKLRWLASQIIGAKAHMITPFGRRRIVYSDHTASGRFLQFAEEYLIRDVLPFYGNTHTVDSYAGLHTSELVTQATLYIKSCLGAGSRDILLFCGSGSTAAIKRLQEVMGIAAPPTLRHLLLQTIAPHQRWVVFVGPYEHHSNLLSWRESLADVVEIGLDESGKLTSRLFRRHCFRQILPAVLSLARSPPAVTSPACTLIPVRWRGCSIAMVPTPASTLLADDHLLLICQISGPYVEIHMRSDDDDGYDAVFISPHMFLGGTSTPGILLMNEDLYKLNDLPPSTCGGGTVHYVNGYDAQETLFSENIEERENAGTPPVVPIIRAALAFAVKSFAGVDLIRQIQVAMVRYVTARLGSNPNIKVMGLSNEEKQPIFSFIIYPSVGFANGKHLHSHFTTRLSNDLFGIQARGGCACAGPYGHLLLGVSRETSLAYRDYIKQGYEGLKPGFTRVSFSYYTSIEEMEFVLDAIEFLAEYGHRFLSLYNFDWITGAWDYRGDETPIKINSRGRRNRSRFTHLSKALASQIMFFAQGKTRQDVAPPPCKEVLQFAKQIAQALPNFPGFQVLPPIEVHPDVITFML